MADTQGMADIRGIDISKVAVTYEDEDLIFKSLLSQATTSAREIRWYQKTSGFLTATAPSTISNVAFGARPDVLEQSWTRNTSYIRKYFVESPTISMEDIKDSDIDVLMGNLRDLTQAIAYQVDSRIWNVLTENVTPVNINTNATNAPWDTASYTGVNIVDDILEGLENIRTTAFIEPTTRGVCLLLSPKDHRSMLNWLIDGKGSSIPSFASARLQDGVVMEILGCKVKISNAVTADKAALVVPQLCGTWKQFTPITARIIEEVGIGSKIRVWEEGDAVLERPKYVNLITNTQA